ncbi:MAG: hypothetical protein IT439_05855 [Phycisphaerales bacterium]|nr:hypothetical protein [Phycisphaerales bacterium]
MVQVRLFVGVESTRADFEKEINTFLAQLRGSVLSITGNIAPQTIAREGRSEGAGGRSFNPSDLFVIVTYDTQA